MSQAQPKPHVVKVYGFHPDEENPTFGLLETKECASKCEARRYASAMKKESYVSSATVNPA